MQNGRPTEAGTPDVEFARASALAVTSLKANPFAFTPYTPMTTDPLEQLREAEGYVVAEVVGDCEVDQ